jgi:hypothetical protein
MNKVACSGPGCPICIIGILAKLPLYIEEAAWKIFMAIGS